MAKEYKLPFTGEEITEKLNKINQLTEELNALNEEISDLNEEISSLGNIKTGNVWYGTCETASATAEKVVTTTTGDFTLTAGNIIYVLFSQAACASATLNIDNLGAVTIYSNGTTAIVANHWAANQAVCFVYDGTAFIMVDGMKASTSYYGITKLSDSTSSTSKTVAATANAVKATYDLAKSKAPAYTYGTTDLTAGTSELATGTLYFVYE